MTDIAAIVAAAGLCALLVTGRPVVRRAGVLAWAGGSVWLASDLLDSSLRRIGTLIQERMTHRTVAVQTFQIQLR